MSKPQVTITLGRSGQKVIKRPRPKSDDDLGDSVPLSGTKRLRGDVITSSSGYNRELDSRIGRNDLRLKLMRKRISRRIEQEFEERKKMELRENMSRSIRSPGGTEWNHWRHISSAKRADEFLTLDERIPKSPSRVQKASVRNSPQRNIDQVQRVPSTRPNDSSRTGQLLVSDVLDPFRMKGPAPITMRPILDARKRVTELPPASGSVPKSSYLGEQPLNVSGLLQSLGLGKYAIHFQAEEVDMAVLKQMGDRDLKELGLPMGPRKKILFAILSLSKRQPQ